MEIFFMLVKIEKIVFYITLFFWVYQLFICLFSVIKEKEKPLQTEKEHKFMAVIPARNEEKVIGNLIKSLRAQNYPKEKLDIYVIADNCTDKTAQKARKKGAIVLERFDSTKKSKGYALEWFFEHILIKKPGEYDAVCVFDADNIVDANFFKEMNKKLCQGEVIVQGYRDIKNAEDTWVTGNYAIFYWMMNRFYHYTRYKIGLSPLINGTAFMVSMSIIEENNGWHTETLTEDIEFSLKEIAKGYKIGWAQDAIVYDEQPIDFKQSWHQRMRWSVGHIQCFKTCMPLLFSAKEKTPAIIDAIIYLLGMPFLWLAIILIMLNFIKYIILPTGITSWIKSIFSWNIIGAIILTIQALTITIIEKKKTKKVLKGLITYPIFLLSWMFINIMAYFNTKLEWKQIQHIKAVDIKEMQ